MLAARHWQSRGRAVGFSITGTGSVFTPSTAQSTDSFGRVTVSLKTTTTAGNLTVTANDGGNTGSTLIVNNPSAAVGYRVTATPSNPIAGAVITVTAQLIDGSNNNVSLVRTVNWSTSGPGGSFSQNSISTNAGGLATVTFTTNTIVGSPTLTADDGLNNGNTTIASIAGPAAKYVFSAVPGSVTVGTLGISVSAQLSDANSNPVMGSSTVTFTANGVGGTFVPATTNCVAGLATVLFNASQTAGSATLSVSDATFSGSSTAIVTIAGSPAKYTVSANPAVPAAGSVVAISAQLTDSFGNNLTNNGLLVNWSEQNNLGDFASNTTATNNGIATVNFTVGTTSNTPYLITGAENGHSGNVAFTTNPAAPTACIIAVTPTNPAAGSSVSVTAQLADTFGNLVKQSNVALIWTATASGFSSPHQSSNTNALGIATITFTRPGRKTNVSYQIAATDAAAISGISPVFTSLPGSASQFLVTVDKIRRPLRAAASRQPRNWPTPVT